MSDFTDLKRILLRSSRNPEFKEILRTVTVIKETVNGVESIKSEDVVPHQIVFAMSPMDMYDTFFVFNEDDSLRQIYHRGPRY